MPAALEHLDGLDVRNALLQHVDPRYVDQLKTQQEPLLALHGEHVALVKNKADTPVFPGGNYSVTRPTQSTETTFTMTKHKQHRIQGGSACFGPNQYVTFTLERNHASVLANLSRSTHFFLYLPPRFMFLFSLGELDEKYGCLLLNQRVFAI